MRFDEVAGIVGEQSMLDPPTRRMGGLVGNAGGSERGRIADRGMAIDAHQPHRPVANDRVQIGAGRHAALGPQFLIPSEPADPVAARIGGGIGLEARLHVGNRIGPANVELKQSKTELHDVPMRVNQPGKHVRAVKVEAGGCCGCLGAPDHQPLHSTVIADQQAGEMLDLAAGVDLDAVGVDNQRVGRGGGGRKGRSGEQGKGDAHARFPSIVWPRRKG